MKDNLIPLHDILREIEFLNSSRDRMTFESFKSSSTDVRAASYSILIISEAARRIPDEWIAEFPNTPWRAIRAIVSQIGNVNVVADAGSVGCRIIRAEDFDIWAPSGGRIQNQMGLGIVRFADLVIGVGAGGIEIS
jgi:hypothetical protein